MKIRHLHLKNWMNYQKLDADLLHDRMFVIGPNASGKSNLLDALRFLRDIALPSGVKPSGGGLQKAVGDRGGLSKLRCVNARQDTEVLLELRLEESKGAKWVYRLGFKGEGKANNRIVITQEHVQKQSKASRQIIITTHSAALLSDRAIPAEEVIRLQPAQEGTRIDALDTREQIMLESGLAVGEVLLETTKPKNVSQLVLSLQ